MRQTTQTDGQNLLVCHAQPRARTRCRVRYRVRARNSIRNTVVHPKVDDV